MFKIDDVIYGRPDPSHTSPFDYFMSTLKLSKLTKLEPFKFNSGLKWILAEF